ncbi:Big [Melia azedarach]|uniref:Big n=1 Tax=Melia azedarach TaxID=155640 RepID=A0ACC1XUZ8_MELAZ|nr:Big [Melia azedarach]
MELIHEIQESIQNPINLCMVVVAVPPPLERFWVLKTATESITKQEIANFWRQKRIDEEEHLLAAIKAAARIRACSLKNP